MIEDAALPILRDLSSQALSHVTGVPDTTLLRLRYRPGKRAILHVSSPQGEGALWAFAGDKGRRIARRTATSHLHDASGTLFQAFPNDHRLPEIAALLQDWPEIAPHLIRGEATGSPQMLRYRPGLSCTFRAQSADGRTRYIKVIGDDDVTTLAAANARLCNALLNASLRVAPVTGTAPRLKAIAYAAAEGQPLDLLLRGPRPADAIMTALTALDRLNGLAPVTPRVKDADFLRQVALASADMVTTVFPGLADMARQIVAQLDAVPPMALCQIHGDMKLEHVFVDGNRVTLIDTETMAIGPADYDRAMLAGRLNMAVLDDALPKATASAAQNRIAARSGQGFDWCRAVVALRLAKFHAQHPGGGARDKAAALLRALLP